MIIPPPRGGPFDYDSEFDNVQPQDEVVPDDSSIIMDALVAVDRDESGGDAIVVCLDFLQGLVAKIDADEHQESVLGLGFPLVIQVIYFVERSKVELPETRDLNVKAKAAAKWLKGEYENLAPYRENLPLFAGPAKRADKERAMRFLVSWHETALLESRRSSRPVY